MRKITVLTALAVLAGSFSAASAADLSMKDYAPAPVWSGMYAGGHIGGAWGDDTTFDAMHRNCSTQYNENVRGMTIAATTCNEWKKLEEVSYDHDDDDTNFIGGLQIGRNWQYGETVLGVEGDVSFSDGFDYLASLRLRAGLAQGNLLLYITGGVAFAGFDDDAIKFGKYTLESDDDDSRVGAVIGAGLEYKIQRNLSVGIEGLYYAFADSKYDLSYINRDYENSEEVKINGENDNDFFVIRGRLNYHFTDDSYAPLK
ncbi:MAG: hypothetical protein P8Y67_08905 [Alphaproteobacteria bacterium]